jgi:hypothetical protein
MQDASRQQRPDLAEVSLDSEIEAGLKSNGSPQASMAMMGVPQQCWLSVFQGEARVEKGVFLWMLVGQTWDFGLVTTDECAG